MTHKRISLLFAVLFSCPLFFPGLAAEEITVPDIETRIRNSGNSVPSGAVPELKPPPPAELPPVKDVETIQPPAEATVSPSEAKPAEVPAPSENSSTGLGGYVELGGGTPGLFHGLLHVGQDPSRQPGFFADFAHDSADGYGGEDAGAGFFDRETALSLRFFRDNAPRDWHLSASLSERADGLQGQSPDYFSLTSRSIDWSGGLDVFNNPEKGLKGSVSFDGNAYSAFAERPGNGPNPAVSIDEYRGYLLSPGASLEWKRGEFTAGLSALYSYDTVADVDELNTVKTALSLSWNRGFLDAFASVGFLSDSEDGAAVPFKVGLSLDSPGSIVKAFDISGGISADRATVRDLAREDPFVIRAGMPVNASDWNVSASADIALSQTLSARADAEYRKSLEDRGILVTTGEAAPNGLILYERVERESLVTGAGLDWAASIYSLGVGYSGEWMDSLYRESLHWLTGTAAVSDPDKVWSAKAEASFALDSTELPRIGLMASYRPVSRLLLSLSVEDLVPLAGGQDRMLDDVYQERSGSVMLSGRIDF